MKVTENKGILVIIGNSNRRFSGVTSTMLQNLEHQTKLMELRVLGKHHLPRHFEHLAISFSETIRLLKAKKGRRTSAVFHARRNDEMIQALALKWISGADLKIIFTSTAQRHHSWLTRWLMSKMSSVITTCSAAASYLRSPPDSIIPHGVDTALYQPDKSKKNPEKIRVAMFGRVREQKGTHLFVRACVELLPKHPRAEAIIVGAISSENESWVNQLKQKINAANLQDRIKFLGEQPFSNIPSLYQSADLVVALSKNEGFGLTVLEAMSSGVAVLATEAGAWPDIIEPGKQGFIIPTDNLYALNSALNEMLSNPDNLEHMGNEGRKTVLARYQIADEAKRLCNFYASIANEMTNDKKTKAS